MKHILALFFFLGIGLPQEETIEWSQERKLTWNDFRGRVPQNNRAAAITASGISYQFATRSAGEEMEIDFKVNSFFYPDKSWCQPALCDSIILGHEQLHFDITELYARKMRVRLQKGKFTSNVKKEVKIIYKEILTELEAYQDQYDLETNFSRDTLEQRKWQNKIKNDLDECCS